jgi:hypothetical protein
MIHRQGFLLLLTLAVTIVGCGSGPEPAPRSGSSSEPAASSGQPPPPSPSPAPSAQASPGGYKGSLPPLEMAPYVTDPVLVRAVYEFAARQPEVLRYVPCFCGCERNGHQGNEDCFVAARAPDGMPQWDYHGMG